MSSHPLSSRSRVNSSSGKVPDSPAAGASMRAPGHVDRDLERRVGGHRVEQGAVELLAHLDRQQALLGAVVAEDVGEAATTPRPAKP